MAQAVWKGLRIRATLSATLVLRSRSANLRRIVSMTAADAPMQLQTLILSRVLGLGCQGLQQPGHADDRHHALHVVGEHIERHLGGHLRQPLREKVRCTHPALDGAERMLRCLTTQGHLFRMVVEPLPELSPARPRAPIVRCAARGRSCTELSARRSGKRSSSSGAASCHPLRSV